MIYHHATRDRDQAIAKVLGTFVREARDVMEKMAGDPERGEQGASRRASLWHVRPAGPAVALAGRTQTTRKPSLSYAGMMRAGDGNRTRITSFEGVLHWAVRCVELGGSLFAHAVVNRCLPRG
jgi:hypothetical protein